MFAKRCYDDLDVADRLSSDSPFRIDARGEQLLLSMHLPFVSRAEVELSRNDDELVVTVGPYRRALLLPDSLARRDVGSARFADDRLVIEFR
jgi:arsenite-transporting ATPase